MHADLNVHYHKKTFQKQMLIFACCIKLTSSMGQNSKLKNVEICTDFLFSVGHMISNYFMQIYRLNTHVDYHVCDFCSEFLLPNTF